MNGGVRAGRQDKEASEGVGRLVIDLKRKHRWKTKCALYMSGPEQREGALTPYLT